MFSYMYVCRGERGGEKGIKQLASWPVGPVWMFGNPVPSQAEAFQSLPHTHLICVEAREDLFLRASPSSLLNV